MKILNLFLSSLLVIAAGSAQAALVTFDLRSDQFLILGPDAIVTSDRGTTANIRAYASSGNLQDSKRDQFGSAPSEFSFPDPVGRLALFSCAPDGASCAGLEFLFDTQVRLVSAEVNLFAAEGPSGNLFVDSDANAPQGFVFDEGDYPPKVVTVDFGNRNLDRQFRFTAYNQALISLRSITVDDPRAVPEPATLALVCVGLLGIGAVRRGKSAR